MSDLSDPWDIVKSLIAAMELWGQDEDGVPEDGPIAIAYDTAREQLCKKYNLTNTKNKTIVSLQLAAMDLK